MIRSAQAFAARRARRGTIVPLLALSLVALVGFLALAIDIGMLAVAKTQAQQAADLACLTAARTLNGDPTNNYNQATATSNAQAILSYNVILNQQIQSSQLQLTYGSYDYNQSTQMFNANFPATSGVPVTAVSATVTANNLKSGFSTVFGWQFLPTVTATAQAVHRPRDIALVMDLSGSMRMGTCLGFDFYTPSRTTNNPDTVVPSFGHYSSASSSLIGTSSNRTSNFDSYTISPSNTTVANTSYTLTYINNFYQNNAYATTLIRAFDSYTSTDGGNSWASGSGSPQLPPSTYASTPGGDVPLFAQGSTTTYATNVKDVLGDNSMNIMWELDGYSAYKAGQPDTSGTGGTPKVWTQADYSAPSSDPNSSIPFNGYTQGPGYYGKTFFLWPPDPRNTNALSSNLTNYLQALGITDNGDLTTLSNNWATWQSQGSTGLSNLQSWLKGGTPGGVAAPSADYSPTGLTVNVSTWNGTTIAAANQPKIYYAVCRLFNWAYPAGGSGTSSQFHADWRLRFFGTNDNSVLFNSSGSLNVPGSSTYTINYNAILTWLAQSNNPFPQQLRAGRIKYYGAIPTAITGSWPSYGGTDQRFWVEVIDHILGFRQTADGVYQDISGITTNTKALAGYGRDFAWGDIKVQAPFSSPPKYMHYRDNPARPLLRYWFGPLLMVDYLHNYNMGSNVRGYFYMQAGDTYEAPLYNAKQAYVAAINTMQLNHPNDWVTVVPYSWPRSSANGTAAGSNTYGRFNCVMSPLGPNYAYATSALLFPFSTINADGTPNNTEVTPYDADPATNLTPSANFVDTPRADGDTCFAMALMLCYNQFAVTQTSDTTLRSFVTNSPITFPTGMAGGMGRKGAQKVIIFETDGLPNCMATATLNTSGTYNYYPIRYDMNKPNSSEYPAVLPGGLNNVTILNQVYTLVQQLSTDYSTSRNPFRLYAIGFGPVFQGPDATSALTTLQTMQYYAGTQTDPSTALPSNQIITGTGDQMSANLTSAFTGILQKGVQIALIK
jgi:Flp pilus assembly protein TadG